MTTDRVAAIEALLAEAEAAHGVYETTELNGVYDTDWPRWYAGYAIDHGIGAVLGREITADELARQLTTVWDVFQQTDPRPSEPWATYFARRLAEDA
jgi:uridylate kinase